MLWIFFLFFKFFEYWVYFALDSLSLSYKNFDLKIRTQPIERYSLCRIVSKQKMNDWILWRFIFIDRGVDYQNIFSPVLLRNLFVSAPTNRRKHLEFEVILWPFIVDKQTIIITFLDFRIKILSYLQNSYWQDHIWVSFRRYCAR